MKYIRVIIFVIILNLFVVNVNASNFNVTLDKDTIETTCGSIVDVLLTVDNINMGSDGINTIEGYINYDEDVIDSIELIDKNNWKHKYNTNKDSNLYGKFLTINEVNGIKDREEFLILKIKIKNKVYKSKSIININKIISNDGDELVSTDNKSIILNIKDTTNPITNDNINTFIIIGIISLITLLLLIRIKKEVLRYE